LNKSCAAGAPLHSLADKIDALLPQTQCTQCGFSGCKPYAQAIADGRADINQCPPGGDDGIRALAVLLRREIKPLNPVHGVHKPFSIAVIDEAACIGCALCIKACPVDAILGAAKQMHTILTAECSGCELCLAPCPVDCISMQPIARPASLRESEQQANQWRRRHLFRLARLSRNKIEKTRSYAEKTVVEKNRLAPQPAANTAAEAKQAAILRALKRTKQ
jgi:Na+-translocating ferredoxin:NAD+ oxidoreductase subunit B